MPLLLRPNLTEFLHNLTPPAPSEERLRLFATLLGGDATIAQVEARQEYNSHEKKIAKLLFCCKMCLCFSDYVVQVLVQAAKGQFKLSQVSQIQTIWSEHVVNSLCPEVIDLTLKM